MLVGTHRISQGFYPAHSVAQDIGTDSMRSSNKNRSRNKNPRKTIGNIINRVFESSGPEGKVRGTPQQIIEKYTTLSRDAQTAGDRVAAENFQQHAEHYIRLLSEAQRELGIRQDPVPQTMTSYGGYDDPEPMADMPAGRDDDVLPTIEDEDTADTGLVMTPENNPVPAQAPAPVAYMPQPAAAEVPGSGDETPQPVSRNRSRGPRRRQPREAKSEDGSDDAAPAAPAAETAAG